MRGESQVPVAVVLFGVAVIAAGAVAARYGLNSNVSDPSPTRLSGISEADTMTSSNRTPASAISGTEGEPRFLEARRCALCHSNSRDATAMRDSEERPVAPWDLWQASMMANSAKDPYWLAVLSAEILESPQQKAFLEEKCTRCHAPMAGPAPESPEGELLTYLQQDDMRGVLGRDGVSCAVCHQIQETNLGTPESFTGHFEIGPDAVIYGPHADPFPNPMRNNVGYTPTQSDHVLSSALCATCHTLLTHPVDESGTVHDSDFHEQVPYLEWRNSVFNDEIAEPGPEAKSCQACHMPVTDVDGDPIRTRIAHNPGGRDFPFLNAREPFGRHAFLGANVFIKSILRDNRRQLKISVPEYAFDDSIAESRHFLATQTAALTLAAAEPAFDSGTLALDVGVSNLAGHKLPTAYPSRRVFVRLTVSDTNGKPLFVSGACNEAGELIDEDGAPLPFELAGGPIAPHIDNATETRHVPLYEAVMADNAGRPTFTLLRGASYFKDNRLLPRGWSPDHEHASATAPVGAQDDSDFGDGHDTVHYRIAVPGPGPWVVKAQLLMQTISPRDAAELFAKSTPEIERFQRMYDSADTTPIVLAEVEQLIKTGR